MPKLIISPVKHFAGTVALCDPLTFPQLIALEDTFAALKDLGENPSVPKVHNAMLPALFGCVEEWHLANFPEQVTPANFPATPRRSSARVVEWLLNELTNLMKEADEVPNE